MARKSGNGTLPALDQALERHLDARERPLVAALTEIAGTLRSIDGRFGRVVNEARGMRTQLQSIDTRLGRAEGEVRACAPICAASARPRPRTSSSCARTCARRISRRAGRSSIARLRNEKGLADGSSFNQRAVRIRYDVRVTICGFRIASQ